MDASIPWTNLRRRTAWPPLGLLLALGLAFSASACAKPTPFAPDESISGSPRPDDSKSGDPGTGPTTAVVVATGQLPSERGVEVSFVAVSQEGEHVWRFEVTLRHAGASPDDQLSGWSVLLPDGSVAQAGPSGQTQDIPLRQPPLRSITDARSGVTLPANARVIVVRGHTSGGAPSSRDVTIDLGLSRGPGFTIVHTY